MLMRGADNNQQGVAAGVEAAAATGIGQPWITSKVEACNTSFVRLGHCYEDTLAVARANLAALNRTSLDLMLLHAPTATSGSSNVCVFVDRVSLLAGLLRNVRCVPTIIAGSCVASLKEYAEIAVLFFFYMSPQSQPVLVVPLHAPSQLTSLPNRNLTHALQGTLGQHLVNRRATALLPTRVSRCSSSGQRLRICIMPRSCALSVSAIFAHRASNVLRATRQ
jgi:hypothetical protein